MSSLADAGGSEIRRVLVTGGAGFIGGEVVRRARLDRGWNVHVLDALTYAAAREGLADLEGDVDLSLQVGDVRDPEAVARALALSEPDVVLHLAAESHVDRSIDGPEPAVTTNVLGTMRVLEASHRHWQGLDGVARDRFRVVHVSTDEVYGPVSRDAQPCTEDAPQAPSSPYAASKAGAEALAHAWHVTYGLPVVVSRGVNTYGRWQHPEKLVPTMIRAALDGRPLPVYGDGQQRRDWLHVSDHAEGLLRLAEDGAPGRAYNLAGGAERANLEVVNAIADALDLHPDVEGPGGGHRVLITHVEDRPGHDRRYAVASHRAAHELGWRPLVPFDEGLSETVRWYVANRDWVDSRGPARRLGRSGA